MEDYEKEIVCRQLGYKKAHDQSYEPPPLADNSVPIWLTNVSCGGVKDRGNELNLLQCNFNICDSTCNHDDDVMISCCKF